jgi:hypothetical protein
MKLDPKKSTTIKKNIMKHKLLALGLLVFGFVANASAQETATATSSATVVTPISITKTADMNFGNISVQSATGGTVVLSPASLRTPTGGVTLPATAGTVTAASFTINGQDGYTYAVTLPTTDVTLSNGAAGTMVANDFTSDPATTGILTGGTQILNVGATLNIAAAQADGDYISPAFDVTVNYN